jgi:hypothetical protein
MCWSTPHNFVITDNWWPAQRMSSQVELQRNLYNIIESSLIIYNHIPSPPHWLILKDFQRMVLFQYSSCTICSSTFFIFLLYFTDATFNQQISSGASSASYSPTPGSPLSSQECQHQSRCSLFPGMFSFLGRILNVNFKVGKQTFCVKAFSANAFSLYWTLFSSLISPLLKSWTD